MSDTLILPAGSSPAFAWALNVVFMLEGGDSNNTADHGGQTRDGISQTAYPDIDITRLTRSQAAQIYYDDYWKPAQCDAFGDAVACALFDAAVNHGVAGGTRLLQQAVDVPADGIIGPQTLSAVRMYVQAELVANFLICRQRRYDDICAKDASQTRFSDGWHNRLRHLNAAVVAHYQDRHS